MTSYFGPNIYTSVLALLATVELRLLAHCCGRHRTDTELTLTTSSTATVDQKASFHGTE